MDRSRKDVPSLGARLLYFVAVGLVAAGAVVATALLPTKFVTAALALAVTAILAVDFLARRFSGRLFARPLQRVFRVYLATIGIGVFGSLLAAWALGRGGAAWLTWTLAVAVFSGIVAGSWISRNRSAPAAP